ncbi:hypothetical protein BT69DRAFT_6259 [Atractiella rhizophila]|nr:hypothetical protein BT69DRAFT_6259 [Atractiella rhizophila]
MFTLDTHMDNLNVVRLKGMRRAGYMLSRKERRTPVVKLANKGRAEEGLITAEITAPTYLLLFDHILFLPSDHFLLSRWLIMARNGCLNESSLGAGHHTRIRPRSLEQLWRLGSTLDYNTYLTVLRQGPKFPGISAINIVGHSFRIRPTTDRFHLHAIR